MLFRSPPIASPEPPGPENMWDRTTRGVDSEGCDIDYGKAGESLAGTLPPRGRVLRPGDGSFLDPPRAPPPVSRGENGDGDGNDAAGTPRTLHSCA